MKFFRKIYMFLIFLFLYAPIFVLMVFSFNDSKSRATWHGFTFKWYHRLFENNDILSAFYSTMLIAAISSVIATILGTMAAVGIMKSKKWQRKMIMNITNLPMINPEIVTGVSLMLLFVFLYNRFGIFKPGIVTLIFAHTTFCLPYVILSVMPKLRQMDSHIYEAALDLGCNPTKSFFKVVLPQIMPGIVTGLIMSFTMSIDDFVISYFTGGTTQTLPIAVYSMTRKMVSPEINALSTILFLVVFVLLIVINLRREKDKNSSIYSEY
ncbi:MAG: ABC transporter permease [Clostridia bacterium]|nr:ABC transporter permease [Clostridia bacterium]